MTAVMWQELLITVGKVAFLLLVLGLAGIISLLAEIYDDQYNEDENQRGSSEGCRGTDWRVFRGEMAEPGGDIPDRDDAGGSDS